MISTTKIAYPNDGYSIAEVLFIICRIQYDVPYLPPFQMRIKYFSILTYMYILSLSDSLSFQTPKVEIIWLFFCYFWYAVVMDIRHTCVVKRVECMHYYVDIGKLFIIYYLM